MLFRVLGPLEVHGRDGEIHRLGAVKPAAVLATLLVHPNAWVSTSTLIDATWQEAAPPPSARANLKTYIWRLRRLLPEPCPDILLPRIESAPGRYRLSLAPGELDTDHVMHHAARAQAAARAGDAAAVVSRSEELLAVLRPVDADPAALAELALSGALLEDGRAGSTRTIRHPDAARGAPRSTTDRARPRVAGGAGTEPPLRHRPARPADPRRAQGAPRTPQGGPGRGHPDGARTARHARGAHPHRAGPGHDPGGPAVLAGGPDRAGRHPADRAGRPIAPARVHTLHRLLAAAAGTARTVAVTVPEYAGTLRVAAPVDATADAAADRLRRTSPPGLRLERMDNQHAAAVAAPLPIGGHP